jgi:hypothetical protein
MRPAGDSALCWTRSSEAYPSSRNSPARCPVLRGAQSGCSAAQTVAARNRREANAFLSGIEAAWSGLRLGVVGIDDGLKLLC